jgi:hypothetical protein
MNREKAISDCVNQFSKAVLEYSTYIFSDSNLAGRYYNMYIEAMRKLSEFGDDGLSALATLMDNENLVVRITTASYLMHFDTAKALEVLKEAKYAERGIAMLAIVTLKRWETGTYLDPATGFEISKN